MKRDLHERLRKFARGRPTKSWHRDTDFAACFGIEKNPFSRTDCRPNRTFRPIYCTKLCRSAAVRALRSPSAAASSRAHFISIIETSEREARETQAALEIIIDQEYVKPSRLASLYQESSEIVAILTTIAKRAKENIALGKRQKK